MNMVKLTPKEKSKISLPRGLTAGECLPASHSEAETETHELEKLLPRLRYLLLFLQ